MSQGWGRSRGAQNKQEHEGRGVWRWGPEKGHREEKSVGEGAMEPECFLENPLHWKRPQASVQMLSQAESLSRVSLQNCYCFFCMTYFPRLDGFPVITNWSILPRNTNVWQHGNSCPASWLGSEAFVCRSQPVCLSESWNLRLSPSSQGFLHKLRGCYTCLLLCWNRATMTPTSRRFQVIAGLQ